jgi:MFS family permease
MTSTQRSPVADRAPLVTKPFVAVTASSLVFFTYIGMVLVTVPRFVEDELGGGEFAIGLTLASFAAAAILARPAIGRIGDRSGRRMLMLYGALLAAAAGAASGFVDALWQLLALRAVTGVGEAAMFVGAATLIADLSPPLRRAEGASYFSVAVFGGLGIGPVLGEWVLDDDRFRLTFLLAAGLAVVAALLVFAVPARIDRTASAGASAGPRARRRFVHRAAWYPGLVLASGIAAFSVIAAFLPDHARTVGLSGAGGLFLVYSVVCVSLRILAATVPERLGVGRTVSIALVSIGAASFLLAVVTRTWGLWVAMIIVGVGMAFQYPSLMAQVVDDVDEEERASALSSFTMFMEVGTIVGGLVLGGVGEILGKRAGFAGGVVMCALGLVVLWTRVVRPVEPPVVAVPCPPTAVSDSRW